MENPNAPPADIGLPGLSGYDLARRIRDRERLSLNGMVLVAQTGWGQDADRRRSREAGFDYHLVKPVEMETLQEILRSAVKA